MRGAHRTHHAPRSFGTAAGRHLSLPSPRTRLRAADDVTLHNPLQRLERSGTGWFGVILSHEGVLVADSHAQHCEAWVRTAADLGFPRPLGALLTCVRRP